MSSKTKEIFLVGCIAFSVGLLFILPPLALKHYTESEQKKFALIQLKTHRDEIYVYVPRAREVYDGHFIPSDVSLNNKQEFVSLDNIIPPAIFALFMSFSKGNTTWAYLNLQFVLSAVIFVLFYIIGRLLFRSKSWSVFFALLGVLTPFISNIFAFDFRDSFKVFFDFSFKQFIPIVNSQIDKLRLARVDNPLLVYPFYLLAIIYFVRFWKQPSYRLGAIAGFLGAILVYVYHRTWLYWLVYLCTMFFLTLLFFRQKKQLINGYKILFGTYAVFITPYFWIESKLRLSEFYYQIYQRSHTFIGRDLNVFRDNWLDYIFYGLVFLIIFLFYIKENKESTKYSKGFLLLGFIISAIIVRNIQFLTGQAEAPIAWRYPIAPVLFILSAALFSDFFECCKNNLPKLRRLLVYMPIVLSFLVFSKYAVNSFSLWQSPNQETLSYYKFPSEVVDSWDWVNSNLESEPKIISPSYVTSIYLTSYTSARPFLPRGHLSLASNFELEDRLISSRKLFGVPSEVFKEQLQGTVPLNCSSFDCFPDAGINANKTMLQLYGEGYKEIISNYVLEHKNNKIDELLNRYKIKTDIFKEVDADYIYQGPWEKQLGNAINFSEDSGLLLVYENNLVKIYKILK